MCSSRHVPQSGPRHHRTLTPAIIAAAMLAGGVSADTLQVPDAYPTIQAAIDAAVDGDVVLIAPGTYAEAFDVQGKSIELRGDGVAAEVILSSPDGGMMLFLDGGDAVTTRFTDLTFTGGVHETLIGIEFASPVFERCIFRDNLMRAAYERHSCASTAGGTYRDCLFLDNVSPNGGAIYLHWSNATIDGSAFVGNRAEGDTSGVNSGGAIYVNDWDCGTHDWVLRDTVFAGNVAVWGGAIYSQGFFPSAPTTMAIEQCLFIDNSASQGLAMWNWYITVPVSGSWFCGNPSPGAQIRHSWQDLGGNVFSADCAGVPLADCDGDRIPDGLSILLGVATDCDGDGVPDVCSSRNPCCPRDFTVDWQVDMDDVIRLLTAWGPCSGCPEDLDADGLVSFGDLIDVLSGWGPCP